MTTIFILICILAAFTLGDSHLLRDAVYAVRARFARRSRTIAYTRVLLPSQGRVIDVDWRELDKPTCRRNP